MRFLHRDRQWSRGQVILRGGSDWRPPGVELSIRRGWVIWIGAVRIVGGSNIVRCSCSRMRVWLGMDLLGTKHEVVLIVSGNRVYVRVCLPLTRSPALGPFIG